MEEQLEQFIYMIIFTLSSSPELSKKLDEYTGVLALGGTETFTCEYHGDVEVSTVTWSYNGTTSLPSGYNVADVSYLNQLSHKFQNSMILIKISAVLKCANFRALIFLIRTSGSLY